MRKLQLWLIWEETPPLPGIQSSSICIGPTWYLFEILHLASQQLCDILVLFEVMGGCLFLLVLLLQLLGFLRGEPVGFTYKRRLKH